MEKPAWFMEHEQDDKDNFGAIHSALAVIKDNHLAHIQIAQEDLARDQIRITNDLKWVRWLVMGIAGGIGLVAYAALTK